MAEEKIDDSVSLPTIFRTACRLHDELENFSGSTGDEKYQKTVKAAVDGFERTTRLVNALGLFSRNEQLEDVPTTSIKYLMCPAYLMDTTMKISGMEQRFDTVRTAKAYAQDFLTRCKDYGITAESLSQNGGANAELAAAAVASSGQPSSAGSSAAARMQAMAASRQATLDQHRRRRQLEMRVKELARCISDDGDSVDDEVEREYSKTLLLYWTMKVSADVRLIDQELQILEHMEKMKGQRPSLEGASAQAQPERRPFKPVVITREKIKAGVFGAGYPSLPTMSVEEFYEKECEPIVQEYEAKKEGERIHADRIKRGLEEDPSEAVEADDDEDADDDEKLRKQRAKDDWKDDHRRGYGNRHNRS